MRKHIRTLVFFLTSSLWLSCNSKFDINSSSRESSRTVDPEANSGEIDSGTENQGQDNTIPDKNIPALTISGGLTGLYSTSVFSLSGTCQNNLKVSFSGDITAKEVICVDGAYTTSVNVLGSDGNKTIKVSQTNSIGTSSKNITVTKDTVAPAAPSVNFDAATPAANGKLDIDFFGTCSEGSHYQLQATTSSGSPKSNAWISCSDNIAQTLAGLGHGLVNIDVYARDKAGNISSTKTTVQVYNLTSGLCADNPTYLTNTDVTLNGPEPHVICTLDQMQQMKDHLSISFQLGANIMASKTNPSNPYNADSIWADGKGWVPVGTSGTRFSGNFNGNGFTIEDLYINRASEWGMGLFGATTNNTIANVTINNAEVTANGTSGILLGNAITTEVDRVSVFGNITSTSMIGGLAANLQTNSIIKDSRFIGNVSGGRTVGGLLATGTAVTILRSYTEGSVAGIEQLGGLAGELTGGSSVTDSFSLSDVTSSGGAGFNHVGGLIANGNNLAVARSFARGNVNGDQVTRTGGLIGGLQSTLDSIIDSYATGNVTSANATTGGLLGGHNASSTGSQITNTYASGNVSSAVATTSMGGLIGSTDYVAIANSFSAGAVNNTGGSSFGLIGWTTAGTQVNVTRWYDGGGTAATTCYGGTPDGTPTCAAVTDLAPLQTATLSAVPVSSWSTSVWEPRAGYFPRLVCPAAWVFDCNNTWYASQD